MVSILFKNLHAATHRFPHLLESNLCVGIQSSWNIPAMMSSLFLIRVIPPLPSPHFVSQTRYHPSALFCQQHQKSCTSPLKIYDRSTFPSFHWGVLFFILYKSHKTVATFMMDNSYWGKSWFHAPYNSHGEDHPLHEFNKLSAAKDDTSKN
jgi:hypothetical protein